MRGAFRIVIPLLKSFELCRGLVVIVTVCFVYTYPCRFNFERLPAGLISVTYAKKK